MAAGRWRSDRSGICRQWRQKSLKKSEAKVLQNLVYFHHDGRLKKSMRDLLLFNGIPTTQATNR
jgi:hypothetical protein